jgi:DNA-binding transcriptional MerR regulator
MKIAEFEQKVGLSRDTLRYYEKKGLLSPPKRGANGYRYYGKEQLHELAFITKGKAIGFTLTEIKQGYQRYKTLGYLCPEFVKQLNHKKISLAKQIESNQLAINKINEMLK